MNRHVSVCFNGATLINSITQNIEDAAQCCGTNWYADRLTGVDNFHATHHSIGTTESNGSNSSASEVLLNFTSEVDFNTFVG